MAEDLEARVTELRIDVGGLKVAVHDHENDIRAFGPLVTEQALIRQMAEREFQSMRQSLDGAHQGIRELSRRIDDESRERVAGQAERKAELESAVAERNTEMARMELERDRQHREMRANMVKAAMGLIGVFLAALASVVVQLLNQGGTP